MDKTKSPTIAEIIQRAALELDGIGLHDALLEEATVECEEEMVMVAAKALRTVLIKRIELLSPRKQPKKSTRAKPTLESDQG